VHSLAASLFMPCSIIAIQCIACCTFKPLPTLSRWSLGYSGRCVLPVCSIVVVRRFNLVGSLQHSDAAHYNTATSARDCQFACRTLNTRRQRSAQSHNTTSRRRSLTGNRTQLTSRSFSARHAAIDHSNTI